MLLGRARRSYDSGPPTPPSPIFGVDDGDDEQSDSSRRRRSHSNHHRSASSSGATPRPKPSVFRSGPFLALPTFHHEHDRRRQQHEALLDADNYPDFNGSAPHARPNLNINTLSSDPFLAAPQQQSSRRLGFFTASNSISNPRNTSPSPSQHLKHGDRSHSHPCAEAATFQSSIMASVASSNTLKSHTSPSKPSSTRTYDAKLVSREMHRLGTLAGLNPSIAPSLSTGPVAPPLTLTPSTSPSSSGIASTPTLHSSASSVGITDKDNPWRTLHVHVLPLFNEEPLRVPIEDLNALLCLPSKTLATLETDARELIAAGMVTLNAKLSNISDEILLGRVIEIWAFFWDQILPYIEGVLLPLQTDSLLTSLHRTQKQHRSSSPTRQGSKLSGSSALSSLYPTIDVRSVALCAFRDRVVLPIHSRLQDLLSPPFGKDMLARLSPFRQPRLQQMLLVLTSERRVRSPSPPLSLHTPIIQPSAGEAAIESLLRLVSNPQRLSHGHGLAPRAATPSFLSAGRPRDRRGRIGSSGAASVLGIVGGWATMPVPTDEREEEEEGGETPKIGGIDKGLAKPYHQRGGGWGLGAGNEDIIRPVEEDDDDEALDWDQAQAAVEKMVGIKPVEAVADLRRRAT
ncbi:HbrB-like-domain-containing protein [Suillus subaureus]|uniref:HbrB-like-domain-containing protein n=1 Tax=Suillus subaureus TaxID=48587 RepID=A0A9P7E6S4_9AGAM|nr:HbrB-like-domain-containing protein [Suillus subaureus]KAG1812422.1 HbrB-like-domain-containing protein [Suillus subaureus]